MLLRVLAVMSSRCVSSCKGGIPVVSNQDVLGFVAWSPRPPIQLLPNQVLFQQLQNQQAHRHQYQHSAWGPVNQQRPVSVTTSASAQQRMSIHGQLGVVSDTPW